MQTQTGPKRPVNSHKAYHAHVYFDANTRAEAKFLCEGSGKDFGLRVGTFHERLVGPHTMWSCQINFGAKQFEEYIAWLDKNRNGLTIFIHPITGDDLVDHTEYAYWLGKEVPLNLGIFGV